MEIVSYDVYYKSYLDLQERIDPKGEVEVFNMNYNETVELGINWCAIGTCHIERAKEFSEKLLRAIAEVEKFPYNGYKIVF